MPSDERQFDYGPPGGLGIACVVVTGIFTAVFVNLAQTNEDPLVRFFITLSPGDARVFYWCLAGLALCCTVFISFIMVFHLLVKQRVSLTPTSLIVPKSKWSAREVAVDYRLITALKLSRWSRSRFLKVSHPNGSFTIQDSYLPDKSDFDVIYSILQSHVNVGNEVGGSDADCP